MTVWYRVVEGHRASSAQRWAAATALLAARRDLDLAEPIHIAFFEELTGVAATATRFLHREYGKVAGCFADTDRLRGLTSARMPGWIFVKRGMSDDETMRTVAHECRHLHQFAHGWHRDADRDSVTEIDARRYEAAFFDRLIGATA